MSSQQASLPKEPLTHKTFDNFGKGSTAPYGSIKERKVNPDLQEERAKINFDQAELTRLIYGSHLDRHQTMKAVFASVPELQNSYEFYEMSREE